MGVERAVLRVRPPDIIKYRSNLQTSGNANCLQLNIVLDDLYDKQLINSIEKDNKIFQLHIENVIIIIPAYVYTSRFWARVFSAVWVLQTHKAFPRVMSILLLHCTIPITQEQCFGSFCNSLSPCCLKS